MDRDTRMFVKYKNSINNNITPVAISDMYRMKFKLSV